jgi:hypothetical protein
MEKTVIAWYCSHRELAHLYKKIKNHGKVTIQIGKNTSGKLGLAP